MNAVSRLIEWLKKVLIVVLGVLCTVAIFWGILYKLFVPFTPTWVDEITIAAVPLGLLVALLIGRPSKKAEAGQPVELIEVVPDAAAQLVEEDHSHSD